MSIKGTKTVLSYGDGATIGASTTFTDIAKIIDIKPMKADADSIELSNMDSPVDANGNPWKEFTAGWADGGEVEIGIQFAKAQNTALYALFRADKGWKITFADGSTWKFSGFIKAFGDEVDREKIVTTTITVKVSGAPSFTAGA